MLLRMQWLGSIMADPSEADLAQATVAIGTLLEGMEFSARLYAAERAVIVECATRPGWQHRVMGS